MPYTYYTSDGTARQTTYFDAFNAGGANGVHGYTFFAPNDGAIAAAASSLAGIESNTTALRTVLQNHVGALPRYAYRLRWLTQFRYQIINGTSVYSPSFFNTSRTTYTSSAGQTLTFTTNSTGTYVQSGNSQARIVQTDVLVNNGVLHVIDGVLVNSQSDPGAASSA